MSSPRYRSHRSAFTLIELLVVIAIIAILAAILFPVFAQAKAAAKKTQDLSNMKNIGLSVQMYESDSDDVLPMLRNGYRDIGCVRAGKNPCEQFNVAHVVLQPYVKSRDIWKSPQDTLVHGPDPYGVKELGGAISYVFTSYRPGFENDLGQFGLMGWDSTTAAGVSSATWSPSLSGTAIGSSASTILLAPLYCTWSYWNGIMQYRRDARWLAFDADDARRFGATKEQTLYISSYPKFDDYGAVWGGTHDGFSFGSWGKQSNFAFADGHAKSMVRQSTMDPMWVSDSVAASAQNKKNLWHYAEQYH